MFVYHQLLVKFKDHRKYTKKVTLILLSIYTGKKRRVRAHKIYYMYLYTF